MKLERKVLDIFFQQYFFIKLSSLVTLFIISGCSKTIEDNALYFPFNPDAEEKEWMSLEEALKKEKYDYIIEVSQYAGKKQTFKQKENANKLIRETTDNALKKGWGDIEKVVSDGYIYEPEKDLTHLINYEYWFDEETLNPEKPEALMFYYTENGPVLAGVAYMLAELYSHGPQIGGHQTSWHFHSYPPDCVENPYPQGHKLRKTLKRDNCEDGKVFVDRSPEMMHVWFAKHPEGPFASMMSINAELIYNSPFAKFANPDQEIMTKEHELKGALRHHH